MKNAQVALDPPQNNTKDNNMSNSFLIKDVPWLSQRDNKIDPGITCFPTSVAMVITYILNQEKLTKADIGCSADMQLEDYIDQVLNSKEITDWMKANTSVLGRWIWDYKRRTVYAVEAQAFNIMMGHLGYKATFTDQLTYDQICDALEVNKLPFIIGGNFSSVSKVSGHMNCLVGFNKIGLREFDTNDPYGNALTGYTNTNGWYMRYGTKFFCDSQDKCKILKIERTKSA